MNIDWTYNRKYTDKFRHDITCGHSFTEVYKPHLSNCKTILEVGTQQGGFIKFCKDQMDDIFFVGVDKFPYSNIKENCWVDGECFNELADDFYIGDGFSAEFLNWVKDRGYQNTFDMVIDDGPHTLDTQIWLIEHSPLLLSDTGVFICEDVDNIEFANKIKEASPYPDTTVIWDNSSTGRWDDICVIIDNSGRTISA